MQIHDYDFSKRFDAEIVSNERLTPADSVDDIRELTIKVRNLNIPYKAGQSVAVLVPGPHDFGRHDHIRLYSIANPPPLSPSTDTQFTICVKRCNYIDEFSGEIYKGIASNYLCDLASGSHITMAGPYGLPFSIPDERDSNFLLIGMGTGIAPFRAMVKYIYENLGNWQGQIRLFYGAKTGLETLYMNDQRDDFANYYDRDTFKAFKALSPRPDWDEQANLGEAIKEQGQEIWNLICDYRTYVYIAGLHQIRDHLEKAFVHLAGDENKWERRKAELIAGHRWSELIY